LINATVLVLDNRQTTIDEIMKVMPGPDFPTGGVICGFRGIKEAYHTGRGKLLVRAPDARGRPPYRTPADRSSMRSLQRQQVAAHRADCGVDQ